MEFAGPPPPGGDRCPRLAEAQAAAPPVPTFPRAARQWSRTGLVKVLLADSLPDGWRLWLQWKMARRAAGDQSPGLGSDIQVLEADGGRYMGFLRMIAEVLPT